MAPPLFNHRSGKMLTRNYEWEKQTEGKYYIGFCVYGGEHGNIITVTKNIFSLRLKQTRIHHYWVFHMWLCFLVNKIYPPLFHTLSLRLFLLSCGTIHRQLFLYVLIYTPNSIKYSVSAAQYVRILGLQGGTICYNSNSNVPRPKVARHSNSSYTLTLTFRCLKKAHF